MTALTLFALTKEERLFLWTGVLAIVIIVGALFIARIDRWRKREMEAGDDAPTHIGSFREMFERGEISREEYDELLRRMAAKVGMKGKLVVPGAQTPAASPSSPATVTPEQAPPSPVSPSGEQPPASSS